MDSILDYGRKLAKTMAAVSRIAIQCDAKLFEMIVALNQQTLLRL